MNYSLAARVLRKFNDRDIIELVNLYVEASNNLARTHEIIGDLDKKIMILEAENRLLKQHDS